MDVFTAIKSEGTGYLLYGILKRNGVFYDCYLLHRGAAVFVDHPEGGYLEVLSKTGTEHNTSNRDFMLVSYEKDDRLYTADDKFSRLYYGEPEEDPSAYQPEGDST